MKRLHVGAVVLLAAAVQVHAALPADGLVPPYGYAEVTVTGQTNVTGLAVSGTLEKRGPGELVLTNLLSLPGTVLVQGGTVTLAEAGLPSALPTALQRGLALWVDANTNVMTDGVTVERWLDVREADTNAPYAYMRAEHDYAYYPEGPRARKPTCMTGGIDVNGLSLIDFGSFGATNTTAAWLPWRNADGTRGVLTSIKAVFAVAAFPNSNGIMLGDWDYTNAGGPTNTVGTEHFWVGDEIVFKTHYRFLHTTVAAAYQGDVYFNGVHSPPNLIPEPLGQLIEVTSMSSLTAANFFNGRNRQDYFPLYGGGRLGEVLVYTNVLTEAERLAVEGYLLRKWKRGGQVGVQQVAAGATLVTDTSAGTDLKVTAVSGGGLWKKTGAGTVSLTDDTEFSYGAIRLEDGVLADNGVASRTGHLFEVPEQGLVVNAGAAAWNVLSTVATNALVKSGAGALTVTGFPETVESVAVEDGTLRLTQALLDPETTESVTIYNNSFEIFDNHDNHGPWGTARPETWGFLPPGTGWTVIGYASPTDGSDTSAGGIYLSDSTANIWCTKQPAPDGDWVAFMKQGGGWETTFTAPSGGRYRLVFFAAGRHNYPPHLFHVKIDGQVISHARVPHIYFKRYEFRLPDLTAGTHTLTFQGINEGSDRVSCIDNVRIERIGDVQVTGVVSNGTFEVSNALTDKFDTNVADQKNPGMYNYTYAVTNGGWTFVVNRSGISEGYSAWLSQRTTAEGARSAYLHMDGDMSTTVTFPTNGTYELSFQTAARPYWNSNPHQAHSFYVKLDGVTLATRVNGNASFETVSLRLAPITNAPVSKVLLFDGLSWQLGKDRSSVIDDVRLVRIPDGDPLLDSGFEMPAGSLANGDTWESGITNTAWTFDLGVGLRNMSGITRNGSAWYCPDASEGAAMAVLQMSANMSQGLSFGEDGYYALSFMAAARQRDRPRYYLHDFNVLFNGEQVGYVRTVDETWRRYTFRLPYVKAGETYTLLFDGINSIYNQQGLLDDHASFIDDVRITKQAAFDETGTPGAYKSVVVDLAAGSKLDLDFAGQVKVKELWYDGRLYSGVLDASNTTFLTGAGSVYVSPKGTLIRIQ